jgi:hypothetical protein
MTGRRWLPVLVAASFAIPAAFIPSPASADATTSAKPLPVTIAGATPLRTDRTIPYWHGQFTDGTNGVTYGFNMAGADPARRVDTTVPIDIVPVNVTFDANPGVALNGTEVVPRVLASPIFSANDFSTTPAVIVAGDPAGLGVPVHNPGGALSAGSTNVQYLDAVMRAQFDAVATSYHLRLGAPTVMPAVGIAVPQKQGSVQTLRRTPIGLISFGWYFARMQNLLSSLPLDPTHLVIFLTNDVYAGTSLTNCCVSGFHGAAKTTGPINGPLKGQGEQNLQSYIVSAYISPGAFDLTQDWFQPDINTLSHEITEWADDPFTNNEVNPWTGPVYGCRNLLEVGDPAFAVGFELPGNTYDTGPDADGMWHPQDEVLLPWMSRQAPNLTSQPTQSPSVNVGRYSFLGDLAPYTALRGPAPTC